jgi:hypothetical protein
MLDDFDISALDMSVYLAQQEKGKNLQCFIGRQFSSVNSNLIKIDSSKKPNQQVCLGHVCRHFLGDLTDNFKCYIVNGSCARVHLKTKDEVISNSIDISNIMEISKIITPTYKSEILEKFKTFVESE